MDAAGFRELSDTRPSLILEDHDRIDPDKGLILVRFR